MSNEDAVRTASDRFYSALNRMANGDARAFADVWARGDAVTAMHPIGGREVGWDAVRDSFGKVAELASDGAIELADQRIRVLGDAAYEVGIERGSVTLAGERVDIEHRVTNVYHRDGDEWKIVHHHTDIAPAMLDVLGRLQEQPKP
jgi:ketosteroid isomerase-like protein